jgi:chromosomal replication initiator protein
MPSSTLTLQDVWGQALAILQDTMKRRSMAKWVAELQPAAFDGTTLTISAPSEFVRGWLESKVGPLLTEKLSAALGTALAVQFTAGQLLLDLPETRATERVVSREPDPLFAPPQLNPKYTFENFVVGKNSQFAQAAALAVSREPGHSYNPLFIYGGAGMGKTHLMQAIGHAARALNPQLKVQCVSGDSFTYQVVTSIRDGRYGDFRDAYRGLDLWLIDDIQLIASRERTEAEFFQAFNTLHETGKQIVITSDRAPKDLQIVDQRLRSRFEWGLMIDIKAPDLETRMAILEKKCALETVTVPEEVIRYIAVTISGNIRTLEGALIKVLAAASFTGQSITVPLAMEQLRDFTAGGGARLLTIADVQSMVTQHFGISLAELTGARRTQNLVLPRQVAMYLCRQLLSASFPEIARQFGGRDHSTVIYACTKTEETMKMDHQISAIVGDLTSRLQEAITSRE